jgi:hypothetical protein
MFFNKLNEDIEDISDHRRNAKRGIGVQRCRDIWIY